MSEEQNLNEKKAVVEPAVKAKVTNKQSIVGIKDLLIPISIIVAGVFIGAGLYLGGGGGVQKVAQVNPAANPAANAEAADTTNKVSEVTEADHLRGSLDAKIKIVEFSDFDCPFCSRFHGVMKSVIEKYDGEVAWVYRHFPLEQLHPQAPMVALASECVAELGGNDMFWSFADKYLETRGAGDKTDHSELVPKLVSEVGLSTNTFNECLESGRHKDAVQADVSEAIETGGRGTPWSIIIGPTGKTYPLNGALPQAAVEQLIETALADA